MFLHTKKGWHEEAWRVLYEQNYGRVYRTALRIVVDKGLAEDVTQEAFVKAFCEINTLKDKSKFTSWICAIAKNTAKNKRKQEGIRNSRIVSYDNNDAGLSWDRLLLNEMENPEIQYEEKEATEEILKLLEELDGESRLILHMKYYQGFTYADIAKKMDRKEGTIRIKAFRAREKIYKELSRENVKKGQSGSNG